MAIRPVSVLLTPCLLILLFAAALATGSYKNQTVFSPKTIAKGDDDHQNVNEKEMKQVVHPGKGVNGGGSDILRQSPKSGGDASSLLDKPFFFLSGKTLIWHITTSLLIPMLLYY